MILNGSGFGLWANHSLVMASYISRANAHSLTSGSYWRRAKCADLERPQERLITKVL
ncbi:MAG: hypothetical protein CM15mP103_11840 [Gammaproteobacteria bacterium]|nr:MAG: hypothetical protein CM15mP103_11840 [Gammaproteobacteria bacterium]